MTVLVHKQTLTFTGGGTWNEKKCRYEGGPSPITLKPTPGPQEVPESVREDETFKEAIKAGLIVEIGIIRPTAGPLPGVPMPDGYQLAGASAPEAAPEVPAVAVPPTLDVVIKAGYSKKVAEGIVAKEAARAAAGYPPYGNTPEPPEAAPAPAAEVPAAPVMTPAPKA